MIESQERNTWCFFIEDEDGEKFGYYLTAEIIEKYKEFSKTGMKTFHFNLESNGRLHGPMKFEITRPNTGYILYDKSDICLIQLGNITLKKAPYQKKSNCVDHWGTFDYHGIKKALCGKTDGDFGGEYFTPKRIVVIQMN